MQGLRVVDTGQGPGGGRVKLQVQGAAEGECRIWSRERDTDSESGAGIGRSQEWMQDLVQGGYTGVVARLGQGAAGGEVRIRSRSGGGHVQMRCRGRCGIVFRGRSRGTAAEAGLGPGWRQVASAGLGPGGGHRIGSRDGNRTRSRGRPADEGEKQPKV